MSRKLCVHVHGAPDGACQWTASLAREGRPMLLVQGRARDEEAAVDKAYRAIEAAEAFEAAPRGNVMDELHRRMDAACSVYRGGGEL